MCLSQVYYILSFFNVLLKHILIISIAHQTPCLKFSSQFFVKLFNHRLFFLWLIKNHKFLLPHVFWMQYKISIPFNAIFRFDLFFWHQKIVNTLINISRVNKPITLTNCQKIGFGKIITPRTI